MATSTIPSVSQRIAQMVGPGQWLYAVLDAARDSAIVDKLCTLRPEFDSLYRGRAEQTLWEVAPYLVRIEPESEFARWILDEGWGKAWGIFLVSSADLAQLHRHFRRFLMVRGPKNERLYFRYYDPRVFRLYLPTCNRQEMATVFGPIASFLVEADDPMTILRFGTGPDQVQCETLGPEGQPPPASAPPVHAPPDGTPVTHGSAMDGSDETIAPAEALPSTARSGRIQQVILEVQTDSGVAKRTWLRPGQTLTIGRTDAADFTVPADPYLSGAHFELSCDFTSCKIRSISRNSGTYVNGQEVKQGTVQAGDEIAAGQTRFRIQIETDLGPRRGFDSPAAAPAAATRLAASIEVIAGPYDGLTADVPRGSPLVIGRTVEKGLSLPNDSSISRRHCQLEFSPPHCELVDLDSSFGTLVQGQQVTRASLKNGDTFKAGTTEFKVHIGAAAVPVKTLRIRKEQMDLLAAPKKADFKKRLITHLDGILPSKGIKIPPDQLDRQIDDAIARSKHYRVSRECDVAQYVEIVIVYLDGFGEKPHPVEARNILYDHRLTPDEKLAKLQAWAETAAKKQ